MDITDAFNDLQKVADADKDQVKEARRRRDLFAAALESADDVVEVIPSGSLARSTQREPINDVDVVAVYNAAQHVGWGDPGHSAAETLDYARRQIVSLLGTDGTYAEGEVRLAKPGNHAIKCWLDDPDAEGAFTVDVMPALRQPGGELLVPEKANSMWVKTNPEFLIGEVEDRQQRWDQFRPLVRTLKFWNDTKGISSKEGGMKSLTIEVLALKHLPAEESRPRALQRFFQAAVTAIDGPIDDPAGLSGEIQSNLDRDGARTLLDDAASNAWHAVNAQDAGETDKAACLWREVFGADFREPDAGCPGDGGSAGGAGFNVGVGAGAGAGEVGVDRPRPVTDTPQGQSD